MTPITVDAGGRGTPLCLPHTGSSWTGGCLRLKPRHTKGLTVLSADTARSSCFNLCHLESQVALSPPPTVDCPPHFGQRSLQELRSCVLLCAAMCARQHQCGRRSSVHFPGGRTRAGIYSVGVLGARRLAGAHTDHSQAALLTDSPRLGGGGGYWAVAVVLIGLFAVGAFILYKFKRQGHLASLG